MNRSFTRFSPACDVVRDARREEGGWNNAHYGERRRQQGSVGNTERVKSSNSATQFHQIDGGCATGVNYQAYR